MAQENETLDQQNKQNSPNVTAKSDASPKSSEPMTSNQAMSNQTTSGGGSGAATAKADQKTEGSGGSTIKEFYDKAKGTAGQVTDKAAEKLDEKKAVVTQGLSGVADSLRQVGESLRGAGGNSGDAQENPIGQFTAKYGDALAGQVEQISDYFERKDVREIVRDVESFARRNPAIFLGSAFALGILAARFLKSPNPRSSTGGRNRSYTETYGAGEGLRIGTGRDEDDASSAPGGLAATNPS